MTIEIKHAETDEDVARLFAVIRALRPHLEDASELVERVARQRKQDYRLIYVTNDAGEPVACAGFRLAEFLYAGRSLYVDDLICLEAYRGLGYAKALMRWMELFARDQGCDTFHLDSGTHRLRAHHFYFREGLSITSFHFVKTLDA